MLLKYLYYLCLSMFICGEKILYFGLGPNLRSSVVKKYYILALARIESKRPTQ